MIRSMTGFGRGEFSDGTLNITAEIRSVNHRYNDISVKLPRKYGFAEDEIKNTVKKYIHRGKTEVSLFVNTISSEDVKISLNKDLAMQYYQALKELSHHLGINDNFSVEYLASVPDVMNIIPNVEDEEKFIRAFSLAVEIAVKELDAMRCVEGKKLSEDIINRANLIDKTVVQVKKRLPQVVKENMEKLKCRITELLGETGQLVTDRILLESAIFADKADVTEEIVRLRSHIIQLKSILNGNSNQDGKKIDFIVQEMNREANTIGSKANDLQITERVLIMKSEIEKIREQVQNIE